MADDAIITLNDAQGSATEVWNKVYSTPNPTPHLGDPIDYTRHPFLYTHSILLPAFGRTDTTIGGEIAKRYLTPAPERILAIGVGTAQHEESLLKAGYAQEIVAYEMAQSAVDAAKARIAGKAYADRLDIRCADILEADIPEASFDVVYVQAAIHHFFKIEEMFKLMHRALKPGGLLICSEFVGPDHHMYPPELLEIMDSLNACLDPKYCHNHLDGQLREEVPRPSLEWMLQYDPSEGVHASRILPLIYQYFNVIERIGIGGTIMRGFFCGILRNFDFTDPKDQSVARLIINTEKQLIKSGVLPHYEMEIVARRRKNPRQPLTEEQCARIAYDDWDPAILKKKKRGLFRRLLRQA